MYAEAEEAHRAVDKHRGDPDAENERRVEDMAQDECNMGLAGGAVRFRFAALLRVQDGHRELEGRNQGEGSSKGGNSLQEGQIALLRGWQQMWLLLSL
jgi:hypothetical protein